MNQTQQRMLAELIATLPVDKDGKRDALFRPSSIDRVIGCVGSTALCARLPKTPQRSTPAQLEGSAAHKLAEEALKNIRQPEEYLDRQVRLNDIDGWFVDEEMVDSVEMYLDKVRSDMEPDGELFVEEKLSLAQLDPSDPLFAENRGTGDAVILNRKRRRITINDLKYGKGVMVPGDAPQLKNYALLALVRFGFDWNEVETCVVQPRAFREAERIKSVMFSQMDLMSGFLPELAGAMHAALDPKAPLTPSDKNCMWCPAKDVCPAVRDRALYLARDAFTHASTHTASSPAVPAPSVLIGTVDHPNPKASANVAVLPSPLSLDPADIATLLDRFDLYDTFVKAVKARAAQMMQAGLVIPGWVLESRAGNRRFKTFETIPKIFQDLGAKAADVQSLLRALGVQTSEMFTDPKMKSPAQIEKLIKRKELKTLIEQLVERPMGEPQLMRADPKSTRQPLPPALGAYKIGAP